MALELKPCTLILTTIAIDLTTSEKYRLQKVSDTDFGAGAMFGLTIAVILLLLLA